MGRRSLRAYSTMMTATPLHPADRASGVLALIPRRQRRLRTECLTPLAVTLGLLIWGMIFLVVRAFVAYH
jgi:hypothetical protein